MGINMLHSFWPSEAIRAFRHVLKLDPHCATAYWGLYQGLSWDYGYVKAREDAITLALKYSNYVSEREQLYILSETPGNDWNQTYHTIMAKYPWDIDAKSFWAWGIVSGTVNYMDAPLEGRTTVQQFLKEQIQIHPKDVGLQHYSIHAWEDTRTPNQAIEASKVVKELSPNAGHVVHMPGHIFYLMSDHNTAHVHFLEAVAADERAMRVFGVDFQEYWEYIHNVAYMVGNLGEAGRHDEALMWATRLQSLDVNPDQPLLLDWDPVYNRPAARYYFQGLLALPLLHFQYSNWAEAQSAITLTIKFLQPAVSNSPTAWLLDYYDALRQYACVMEAFEHNNYYYASTCYAKLHSLYSSLDIYMNRSTENGFQVGARCYVALGVSVQEAHGLVLAVTRKWDEALSQLIIANASEGIIPYNEPPIYTRPVLESIARVYIQRANATGNSTFLSQAVLTYAGILDSPWHNNSGFGWYGIGYSYSLLGNKPAATFAFKEFLKVWQFADQDLPQVVYAKLYLEMEQLSTSAFSHVSRFTSGLTFSISVLVVLLCSVRHNSRLAH